MLRESAVIARVESLARHPVFAGSDEVMREVLDDLRDRAEAQQISGEAFERLRSLLLESSHFRLN